MTAESLREMLSLRPFKSFDVVMSSGQRYRVKHPECAILTKTQMVIVDPNRDIVSICPLLHVSGIESPGRKQRQKPDTSA